MSNAHQIALALGGRRMQRLADGAYLVPCPVRSHGKGRGDRSPSLRVGDGATRVLVHCFAGCDPRDVLDALRRRGLLDGPATNDAQNDAAAPDPDAYARVQHRKAAWLWSRRVPITGTPAETYLHSRGITCPSPPTLAYLPPAKPGHHPALVAAFAITGETEPGLLAAPRNVTSVHLTLLRTDGSGKANVRQAKLMVGSPGPLPIVIAPVNDLGGLAITEGIEDGLTAHHATGLGAWAAGAAGRMPGLAYAIPSYVEAVTIYAHADKAGQDGARGLAERLERKGIDVFIEGLT